MLESKFQASFIKRIRERFPGCKILKNDPNYLQGFPDLTILYEDKWAVLECKQDKKSKKRPNQEHYVQELNEMSYSRFVSPENQEEVLHEMELVFEP